MRTKIIFVLWFLVISFTVSILYSGQDEYPYADNRECNYSSSVPWNVFSDYPEMENFDNIIRQMMTRWGIKGLTLAILKEGKLVYTKGYGYADAENKEVMQAGHTMRIASVSKLITAAAVMKLVEEGRIALQDTVFGESGILNDSVYLKFSDKNLKKVTIEHLLNHTAGWSLRAGDPMFMPVYVAQRMHTTPPADFETIIQYVLTYGRIAWMPGTRSCYSNFGYALLGKIIEKVTGCTYESYVRESILKPLRIYDMTMAGNFPSQRRINESTYYAPGGAGVVPDFYGTGSYVQRQYGGNNIEVLGAAGGWIASAPSLAKILSAFDGYDFNPDLLSPKSIQTMTTSPAPHIDPMGWRKVTSDGWIRTGSFAGTSALMKRQNDSICWVVITNTSTWKGADFTGVIHYTMKKALESISEWPELNLFYYDDPVFAMPARIHRINYQNDDSANLKLRLTGDKYGTSSRYTSTYAALVCKKAGAKKLKKNT